MHSPLLLKTCTLSLEDRVLLVWPEDSKKPKIPQVLLTCLKRRCPPFTKVDIPPPYATIAPIRNVRKARGNDSPQREGQEDDYCIWSLFSPAKAERLCLGRTFRLSLRLQDHQPRPLNEVLGHHYRQGEEERDESGPCSYLWHISPSPLVIDIIGRPQNLPCSEKPQDLISLLKTIFYTNQPTWGDCQ